MSFKLIGIINIYIYEILNSVFCIFYNVSCIFRSQYEDELIERIVVPYLQHVDMDPDITIRNVAAYLLVDLCVECETKRCLEFLDILEKVIKFLHNNYYIYFFFSTIM